jgi:hypothetical protein
MVTTDPAKAPWYFVGLQELLDTCTRPWQVVIPTALVLFLVMLPYRPFPCWSRDLVFVSSR